MLIVDPHADCHTSILLPASMTGAHAHAVCIAGWLTSQSNVCQQSAMLEQVPRAFCHVLRSKGQKLPVIITTYSLAKIMFPSFLYTMLSCAIDDHHEDHSPYAACIHIFFIHFRGEKVTACSPWCLFGIRLSGKLESCATWLPKGSTLYL